jgi:hypothetical protein
MEKIENLADHWESAKKVLFGQVVNMSLHVYDLDQVREELEIAEAKWASQQVEFRKQLTDLESEHKTNVAKLEKQLQDERTRYSELKQDLDSIQKALRDEALKNINRLKTVLNKGTPPPVIEPPYEVGKPSTMADGEEGRYGDVTTCAIPEEGNDLEFPDMICDPDPDPVELPPVVTLVIGEDNPGIYGPQPDIDQAPQFTTLAMGEEGGPQLTTQRFGEEGGPGPRPR